ncbi:MAG: hypothetical protein Q4E69_04620 [Bacilli bacterium]|nr:hypothetical protein [Bacilli bacterium]
MEEKKNNIKKFVLKGINIVICLGGFFLFCLVCFVVFAFTHFHDGVYINSYGNASPEELREARKMLNKYGRSLQDAVQAYKDEHSNELPTIEMILDSVDNPNNISCESNIINSDGSVFLKSCKVGPKVINIDFGREQIYQTDGSSSKLYIYKIKTNNISQSDDRYYYHGINISNGKNIVGTYTCEKSGCYSLKSANLTDTSPKDAHKIIIKDNDNYYFYNVLTEKKDVLSNLNVTDNKIESVSIISSTSGEVNYLFVKLDNNFGAFYNVNTKSYISSFMFEENYTTTSLYDDDLLVGKTYSDKNDRLKYSLSLFIASTGKYIGTYNDIVAVNSFTKQDSNGNKYIYYSLKTRDGVNGFLMKKDYANNTLVNLFNSTDYYSYKSSDSKFIILNKDSNKFTTLDLNGNILYESSIYTSIDYVYEEKIIVRTDKEVLIVNPYGKTISKYMDVSSDYQYGSNRVSITKVDESTAFSYAVHKAGADKGIYYLYIFDTGEIRTKETKNESKYIVP